MALVEQGTPCRPARAVRLGLIHLGILRNPDGPPAGGRSFLPGPQPPVNLQENPVPQVAKGTEPLTARIGVRVTPGEKARLQEDAAWASLSVSELVRRRYFGRPIIARADQAMARELRRLGGLLKHMHDESGGAQRQQAANVLRAVMAAIERLGHDRQKD